MQRCLLLLLFLAALAAPSGADAQVLVDGGDARIARVEQWLKALMRHEPGTTDDAAALVASWPAREVRFLWVDATVIAQLVRDPRKSSFSTKTDEQRAPVAVRYTIDQLRRLKTLACAAGGIVTQQPCVELDAQRQLDADLMRLSREVEAARSRGDENYILRRGALLHTDIAMFIPATSEPIASAVGGGPQRIRILTADGLQVEMGQVAPHWDLARALLDFVRPRGAANPAPGLDDMVRLWYRATAAWMQSHEQHDTIHLNRARAMFPNDPDILFLSGCQHEVYASSPIQSVIQSAAVPSGVKSDVESEKAEIHHAETYFRRATAAKPSMAEAHLRLGHVLLLLERPADAIPELRQALASTVDDWLTYYGQLFLGAALESTRDLDGAFGAYTAAATLYPKAQSPHIALSALARRRGDRDAAFKAIQQVFDRPANDPESDDPWWSYFVAQARNADDLLNDLRRPFQPESRP